MNRRLRLRDPESALWSEECVRFEGPSKRGAHSRDDGGIAAVTSCADEARGVWIADIEHGRKIHVEAEGAK